MPKYEMNFGELTPDQYYGERRTLEGDAGWRRVWFAVLEESIHCFMGWGQTNCGAKGRLELKREAEQWLWSDDPPARWWFTFRHLCELLGIEPHGLRRGLLKKRTALKGAYFNKVHDLLARVDGEIRPGDTYVRMSA